MIRVVQWHHPEFKLALIEGNTRGAKLVLVSIEIGECEVGDSLIGESRFLSMQPFWNLTKKEWCIVQIEASDMTEDEANNLLGMMPGLLS